MLSHWQHAVLVRFALVCFVLVCFALISLGAAASVQTPSVTAHSAILIDAHTGRVLYAKNAHARMYPASITKILTAVVALERGHLDDLVTISPEAARVEGSRMHMLADEQFTLEELLYGLMLVSGNDAAAAIAEHIAASTQEFAKLMNETALRIGAIDSHFTNPHGLPDTNLYTTAHDMALISRYALTFPAFREIVATPVKEIPPRPGQRSRMLQSGNWMLGQGGVDGVKTGFTQAARHTYVASANREGRQVIAVVLRTDPKAQKWRDALRLIDHAYTGYSWRKLLSDGEAHDFVPVQDGERDRVRALFTQDLFVPLRPGEEASIRVEPIYDAPLAAPIAEGDVIGYVNVFVDAINPDQPVARVDLVAAEEIPHRPLTMWERLRMLFDRREAPTEGNGA